MNVFIGVGVLTYYRVTLDKCGEALGFKVFELHLQARTRLIRREPWPIDLQSLEISDLPRILQILQFGINSQAVTGSKVGMAYKDIFWMACDSTEQLRAEYGPFHTREEAEAEARKLGFGYLLRYEHIVGPDDEIEEVRCVFIELQDLPARPRPGVTFHTRCATCGEAATHDVSWQAEVWADIHEFEHTRHKVRLFEHSRAEGLREIGDWRSAA